MKAQNNHKTWTLDEVRTVINYPKTWAWAKACSREIGRTGAAIGYIMTAFNAYSRGDERYVKNQKALKSYFDIMLDPVKNAQVIHTAVNVSSSPIRPVGSPSAIVGEIEKNMEKMQGLFMKLGDAIVREQYAHVNKELEQKESIINDQAREIERLEKLVREQEHQGKFDLKSYFNIK